MISEKKRSVCVLLNFDRPQIRLIMHYFCGIPLNIV